LLKSGKYEPVQVRRVTIPKASGKLRQLGIPTVADRVVQASLKAVLEPIFEADFASCSYGFRPNRRAQDAIAEIHFWGSHFHEWVLEADIQACFDEIEHTPPGTGAKAIRKAVSAGQSVLEVGHGDVRCSGHADRHPSRDTPPLLANIALSTLDDHFDRLRRELMGNDQQRAQRKRRGLGNWKLVRYADDFVVMVSGQRGHAEALREEAAAALAPMGLRLSPEKTRVVHIDEGFDFLGFHIRRMRKRGTNKHYVYTTPPERPVQTAKDKVRWKTRRSTCIRSG
jgi:RNA-directed DNA polymerase